MNTELTRLLSDAFEQVKVLELISSAVGRVSVAWSLLQLHTAIIEAQSAMESSDCDWMLDAYQKLKRILGDKI